MFYQRNILKEINKHIKTREALVITGMRQVGKTTILKRLFDNLKVTNKAFYDFENTFDIRKFESQDYNKIWDKLIEDNIDKNQRAYIFIDEIQNYPKISSIAKYFIDHFDTKFFLTGSSSFYLKNYFPESMSGRKFVFEMYPLTFSEFLNFKKTEKPKTTNFVSYNKYFTLYQEYLNWGGFPGVVLEKDEKNKNLKLKEILNSFFEQDVKTLADYNNFSKLRELIFLLSTQIGLKTDVSKLATHLSVSRETVYSYLNFLEATFFITLLPQFSKSKFKQAAGSKKVYLCDSGVANVLGKLSQDQLFEQSVFQNLRPNHNLSYFDKGRGTEIDFIVDEKESIEAKVTATKRDVVNLQNRSKIIKIKKFKIATLNFSELPSTIPALNLIE